LSFVEIIDTSGSRSKGSLLLLLSILLNSSRGITEKTDLMLFSFSFSSGTKSSSEEIFVFLFWEVYVIVSVWMWILSWIISIILPDRVGSKLSW